MKGSPKLHGAQPPRGCELPHGHGGPWGARKLWELLGGVPAQTDALPFSLPFLATTLAWPGFRRRARLKGIDAKRGKDADRGAGGKGKRPSGEGIRVPAALATYACFSK